MSNIDIDVLHRLLAQEELYHDELLAFLSAASDEELVVGTVIHMILPVIMALVTPQYQWEPYHTSALSGATWVDELIEGHPECIRCKLGVHLHIFE